MATREKQLENEPRFGAMSFGAPLLWILAAAFGVRLIALLATLPTPLAADELDYFWRGALRMQFIVPEDLGKRPPAMEFFYAPWFGLFGVTPAAGRFGNVLISVATIVPLYSLGTRLGGASVAQKVAWLAALYPGFIAYSHYLWGEPLFMFLVASGLALSVSHMDRPSLWRLFAAGLLFGLSALTRVQGLTFPPLLAAWMLWQSRAAFGIGARPSQKALQALRAPACLLVGMLLPVIFWSVQLNSPDKPFALVTRTVGLILLIGNANEPGRPHPSLEYERLGDTREEKETRAQQLAFESIVDRMPTWPFEKLASELPKFFTPTSFPVRRLLMPGNHRLPLEANWAYRFAWEPKPSPDPDVPSRPPPNPWREADLLRVVLAGGVVAAYLALVMAGVFGIGLAPGSSVRQAVLLCLVAQIVPTLVSFAISRFRITSMLLLTLFAAWLWDRGRGAWNDAGIGARVTAVVVVATLIGLLALRWTDLYVLQWA